MNEMMERTRKVLERHLEDLLDEVEECGGRIKSTEVLGGIHKVLWAMTTLDGLRGDETPAGTEQKAKAKEKVSL